MEPFYQPEIFRPLPTKPAVKVQDHYEHPDNREGFSDIITKIHVASNKLNAVPKENVILSVKDDKPESSGRPPKEKLLYVYNVLGESLPKLFVQPLDYTIYHDNMVFEDNIRNIRTVGLYNYVKQVALLRTVGHLKFAFVRFEILKITQHPEDGTVRVRWRITGISTLKVIIQFWKVKLWKYKESSQDTSTSWYDGFSTFVVNEEGKVIKHVADKMMPDSDSVTAEPAPNLNNAKLALMISVIPKFSDIGLFT
ncbi:hypothetical protein ABEB36_007859 [Hypothenemus hampei]|uniref:Uncharacterized protein n=1 Tax=Hypothenemus hampei TaxID=57062 RepID=A0ABD1EVW5_HYPHA